MKEKKRTRKPIWALKKRVPPRQMGIIAMSKGPYLKPFSLKMGHGPLVIMYPESLSPKLN